MARNPFKLRSQGSTFKMMGSSPMKNDVEESQLKVDYGQNMQSITKTKGDSSSTYNLSSAKKIEWGDKKGSYVYKYTNELGNTETRIISSDFHKNIQLGLQYEKDVLASQQEGSPATRKGGWWAKQVKGHGGPS
jgi:hypothetical protein|tara:strand:- start:83 stop:484 length:402 start_codon:yes stop_codon:yes gene_type:complete